MVIKTTRWKPDTCDCVIDYTWDTDVPEDSRVHTGSNIVVDCPEHSGLVNPVDLHLTIKDENDRKNITRKDILDSVPEVVKFDFEGNIDFVDNIKFDFYFTGQDSDRVLHIVLIGVALPQQTKDSLASLAESKFGIGKVVYD